MLTEIYIKNYLFVPEQRLRFGEGMTVLSGETGAGKSILVGSIALIFGNGGAAPEPFDPSQPVYLEASFDISRNSEVRAYLAAQGYGPEDELCLARELSTAGRSGYFLNGRKVTQSLLKELKPLMIDFHHQREQQRLLSSSYQLDLLDLYADNAELRSRFAGGYKSLKQQLRQLEELKAEQERQRQLIELYQYQFDELEKADLKPEEDTALQQEFELLSHAREISQTAGEVAYTLFEGEGSLHDQLSSAIASLARFSSFNGRLGQIRQSLLDCLEIISDGASALGEISIGISHDPERLEAIQSRLDIINNLLYKHKAGSIGELIGLFQQRERQIEEFSDLGGRIGELETGIETGFSELLKAADALSENRARAAKKLSQELQQNIRQLSIPDGRFEIRIDKITEVKNIIPDYLAACGEKGQDSCEFLLSANPGSELRPMSAVASGGELSRILLAVKKVLSERIEEKLIILDEIDAGIGGKTAERVAEYIFQLSRRHRILCITHLAQLAAIAHRQIALRKESGGKKTVISMHTLRERDRLEELARMLSGTVSGISLKHAEELISKYR